MWWRGWVGLGAVLELLCWPAAMAAPVKSSSSTSILIDAHTGQALLEENADVRRSAGSLSQLMILLLSLEQATLGAFPLDRPVTVHDVAPTQSPAGDSKAGGKLASLGHGSVAPAPLQLQGDRAYVLSDLLKAMVVSSAESAAIAVAKAIAGSVPACLELMNARGQRLGMTATHYSSIGGVLPAKPAESDTTTARDLARLAQALVGYPQVSQWASLNGLPLDHGATLLRNANQLIGAVPGVDGLQVSSGRETDYSIVATAQRRSLRLVAVVLGAADTATRYTKAADLLEWGFAHYERLDVVKKGQRLNFPIRVMHGAVGQIIPMAGQTLSLLSRRDEERNFQVRYQLPTILLAPLRRHQPIGELIVEEKGELIAVIPVLSPRSVAANGALSAATLP